MAMEDDMRRMEYLPGNYYNFHPGSHVGPRDREGNRTDQRFAEPDYHAGAVDGDIAGDHVWEGQRSGQPI